MTQTTAGWVDKHKNRHLRSYIPDSVCQALKIENGDKLDWVVSQDSGELIAVMRKVKKPKEKK